MRRHETGKHPGALKHSRQHRPPPPALHVPAPPDAAPPDVPDVAVVRERLLSLLDLAVQQRLTIVVAPPGYGKTVLLAQWAASHTQSRVQWLTLTTEDNDPKQLAEDLRTSLEPPATLVLDDVHLLSNPSALTQLATYLEHAPRSVHFVLATRADPPLEFYGMRLDEVLVELRQEDLAFTRDEAAELLRHLAGRELSVSQIDALLARTEGSAVGLHLAGLSLRERPDADAFVATFTGDDRHVADYLTERVLDLQPKPVRRFLLSTSVLDRLSGPLCEFVTGEPAGRTILEQLDRTSMFVTRLDTRRCWFRYHPLFRALLRHHLRDEEPSLERVLLQRAAEWHLARGELDAGVSYLADAAQWEDVIEQAVVHGGALLAEGRAGAVARWIGRVPAPIRHGRIHLMLLEAGSQIFGGDTSAASQILDETDAVATASAADRAVAHLLRSYSSLRHGSPRATIVAADRALAEIGSVEDSGLPNILGLTSSRAELERGARVTHGIGLVYQGDYAEARRSLEPALEADHPVWRLCALSPLSLLEAWSGRLTVGEQLGTQALSLARQMRADDEPAPMCARLALAHIARERDQLARAHALIEDAEKRLTAHQGHVVVTSIAIERALLALADGEPTAGLAVLAARRAGEQSSLPDAVLARRQAAEARLRIMIGDLAGAERAVDVAPELETSDLLAARVRLAVERGDHPAARALVARWPADPAPRAQLERKLWVAILDHLEGEEASAQGLMTSVVRAAEVEGDIGVFRTAGHHALGPARGLYDAAPSPFVRRVVEHPDIKARVRPVNELVEQITEREYTVLSLLPTRLSNLEMAEQLGVSLNTVKTHLKHIYRKLGVTRRSEAVAVAERLRLI